MNDREYNAKVARLLREARDAIARLNAAGPKASPADHDRVASELQGVRVALSRLGADSEAGMVRDLMVMPEGRA